MRTRLLAGAAVGYVAVRLMITLTSATIQHPDTSSYRTISLVGNAERTWVVPTAMRLFGDRGFTIFQTVISAAAFMLLAWSVGQQIQHRHVRTVITVAVLALGVTPRVTYWDRFLLSESLALSLSAVLIAALTQFKRSPAWLLVTVFALWVFTRDAHLYLGALLLLCMTPMLVRDRRAGLAVAIIGVLAWSGLASRNNDFVEGLNVTVNIAHRADDNPAVRAWFVEHGMPDTPLLNPERPLLPRAHDMYDDPEFREWANTEGPTVYARFLASHPSVLFGALPHIFKEATSLDQAMVDHTYMHPSAVPPGPGFLWPNEASIYSFMLIMLAGVACFGAAHYHRLDRRFLVPGLLALSTFPHALLAFHATPWELARHAMVMSFMLVLSSLWLISLGVDVWLSESDDSEAAVAGAVDVVVAR